MERRSLAGLVAVIAALCAAEADAQTFGFYKVGSLSSYYLQSWTWAKYQPYYSPLVTDEHYDTENWVATPSAVGTDSAAGNASVTDTVTCTLSPDGAASVSVAGTHQTSEADGDNQSWCHVQDTASHVTVAELQQSGLPAGTTFTITAKIKFKINGGSGTINFTERGGWQVQLGDQAGSGGLRITKSGDWIDIYYPNGTHEGRSLNGTTDIQEITAVLTTTAQAGQRVRLSATQCGLSNDTPQIGAASGSEIYDWNTDVYVSQN
jgi:hypothetical protein